MKWKIIVLAVMFIPLLVFVISSILPSLWVFSNYPNMMTIAGLSYAMLCLYVLLKFNGNEKMPK